LPSCGTTKTGVRGSVPAPVGLFASPVAGSVCSVPPIVLPVEPSISRMPLPWFAMPIVPAGLVPM